ncbi:MAG: hypothetical protein IPK82_34495 [Polyangiaceae bacterium]|nr:hypothetical protein [Polyangiaceae bacterium]
MLWPDLAAVAVLMARLLEQRGEGMEKADAAHNAELADDAEPRNERDVAARSVYAQLVSLKQGVGAVFGEAMVGQLHLSGTLPQDAAALVRLADQTVKTLKATKFPKPTLPGVKAFDVDPWVDPLAEASKALAAALKGVTREAREANATLVEKNRSMEAFDDSFSKVTAVAVALLRFCDEEELAGRLRPSARRPGTLESDSLAPEGPGEGAPEGSSGGENAPA